MIHGYMLFYLAITRVSGANGPDSPNNLIDAVLPQRSPRPQKHLSNHPFPAKTSRFPMSPGLNDPQSNPSNNPPEANNDDIRLSIPLTDLTDFFIKSTENLNNSIDNDDSSQLPAKTHAEITKLNNLAVKDVLKKKY